MARTNATPASAPDVRSRGKQTLDRQGEGPNEADSRRDLLTGREWCAYPHWSVSVGFVLAYLTGGDYFDVQLQRIVGAARQVATKKQYDVLLFSHRPEYFDCDEFVDLHGRLISSVVFISSIQQLLTIGRTFDVAIMCSTVMPSDHTALCQMRKENLADLFFVWTFDNHHSQYTNVTINALADIIVPSHKFCANYMRSPCSILGSHVPLATNQWSRSKAKSMLAASMQLSRSNGLHGGFVAWEVGDRIKLAAECRARLPENAIRLIDPKDRYSYFGQSAGERWYDWASHKVGLILPVMCDLPLRFFDSLLVGQVPLVPTWCHDLDHVVPVAMQETLPIIRFGTATVEAVEIAWQEAIRRFDADGEAGMLRRHTYALENHHLVNRLEAICSQISDIATQKNIACTVDNEGVGFVL
jgi:hypothetical protein